MLQNTRARVTDKIRHNSISLKTSWFCSIDAKLSHQDNFCTMVCRKTAPLYAENVEPKVKTKNTPQFNGYKTTFSKKNNLRVDFCKASSVPHIVVGEYCHRKLLFDSGSQSFVFVFFCKTLKVCNI